MKWGRLVAGALGACVGGPVAASCSPPPEAAAPTAPGSASGVIPSASAPVASAPSEVPDPPGAAPGLGEFAPVSPGAIAGSLGFNLTWVAFGAGIALQVAYSPPRSLRK